MYTAFVSDHTVEYVVVPQFTKILSATSEIVIPIFYWRSREGGTESRSSFLGRKIKLIALYPRRPKVSNSDESVIVKINELLFHRAAEMATYGIATFAGVPLVNSLEEFGLDAACTWFHLNDKGSDEFLSLNIRTNIVDTNSHNAVVVQPEEINAIASNCMSRYWSDWIDIINSFRRNPLYVHSLFGDQYKPVYFLVCNC